MAGRWVRGSGDERRRLGRRSRVATTGTAGGPGDLGRKGSAQTGALDGGAVGRELAGAVGEQLAVIYGKLALVIQPRCPAVGCNDARHRAGGRLSCCGPQGYWWLRWC